METREDKGRSQERKVSVGSNKERFQGQKGVVDKVRGSNLTAVRAGNI